jgi:hypothetical protein
MKRNSCCHIINSHLFSRFTADELRKRFTGSKDKKRIAVFDIDGTLHKGLFYPVWKGISNFDLCFFMGIFMLTRPLQYIGYVIRLLRFWRGLDRENRRKLTKSEVSPSVISGFVQSVLVNIPYTCLEQSAAFIVRFHFSCMPFCLRKIMKNSDESVFVSRALYPVLDEYRKLVIHGLPVSKRVQLYGNMLVVKNGKIYCLDEKRHIVSPDDKKQIVKKILLPFSSRSDAVIFGNSSADLQIFDIADRILGEDNVLKIAIKPTCEKLAAGADLVAASWRGLRDFFITAGEETDAQV